MQHVLLDLDGTLVDSKRGIFRCVNHALVQLGRPPCREADLVHMIGPPLRKSFPALLQTDEQSVIELAVAAYRDRYVDVGIFECELFPGVVEMLAALRASDRTLSIVTVKPKPYARRLIEHFELQEYVAELYAPALEDMRDGKGHLVREAINHQRLDRRQTAMVGDRDRDLLAARETGVGSVGVLWGYGTREELAACEPDRLIAAPAQLPEAVTSIFDSR